MDGTKVAKWVEQRIEFLSDTNSFSTDHQAEFYCLSKGLGHPEGTRIKLDLKDLKKKSLKRTVTCTQKRFAPEGPAFFPRKSGRGWGHAIHASRRMAMATSTCVAARKTCRP